MSPRKVPLFARVAPVILSVATLLFLFGELCSRQSVRGQTGSSTDHRSPEKTDAAMPDPALRFRLAHQDAVKAVAFALPSNRVLTLDFSGTFASCDLKKGPEDVKPVKPARPGDRLDTNNYYSPLTVSPNGGLAAVCGRNASDGIIEFYDLQQMKKGKDIEPLGEFRGAVSLSYSTRGDRLAGALLARGALQWSLKEGKSLTPKKSAALPENTTKNYDWAIAVTHLRGDEVIAVGLATSSFVFYNAQSGEELAKFPSRSNDSGSSWYLTNWLYPPTVACSW